VGRKKPIVIGAVLTLIFLFPIFWAMGSLANPGLQESARNAPVVVSGGDCVFDPFAEVQASNCGKLLEDLTALGVPYDIGSGADSGAAAEQAFVLRIGEEVRPLDGAVLDWEETAGRRAQVQQWLEAGGYDFSTQSPPFVSILGIIALLLLLGMLSALTYGSVAALLTEMFPPQIRYSSMSIPYHIGAGYLGGFLPLIAGYIVATTGDAYSGLWYTWAVVAFGLVVAWWGLPDGPPRDFSDEHS
jgi:hypothetical protein